MDLNLVNIYVYLNKNFLDSSLKISNIDYLYLINYKCF